MQKNSLGPAFEKYIAGTPLALLVLPQTPASGFGREASLPAAFEHLRNLNRPGEAPLTSTRKILEGYSPDSSALARRGVDGESTYPTSLNRHKVIANGVPAATAHGRAPASP